MKRIHSYIGFALLAWVLSCTHIEDQQPKGTFETSTDPLAQFYIELDTLGMQTVRFDSVAEGGNFSLEFTPLAHGKIRIVEQGKAVQIQALGGNWEKDSSIYTICKNTVCREGKIILRNRQFVPDTTDTVPPTGECITLATRTLYLDFSSSLDIHNLFPAGVKGTIDSLKADLYQATGLGDSSIHYKTNPIPDDQLWAWDTIRYRGTSVGGQCYKAKIAIILGGTCEPQARDDTFFVPTGNVVWPETALTANDTGCIGGSGSYQTRTPYLPPLDWEYGNYKTMPTPNGVLIDTLVDGKQNYKYRRTNASATEDGFIYYFKSLATTRVTKALVKITF